MKKILVVNSYKKQNKPFLSLFKDLSDSFSFFTWTCDNYFFKNFVEGGKFNKKIYLGKELNGFFSVIFFLLSIVFFRFIYFWKLLFNKKRIDKIILINYNEKIIFTPIAKFLKIKVIWFEKPDIDYNKKSKLLMFCLKRLSKKINIIVFNESKKDELLKRGFKAKKIENISLGVKMNGGEHQDNIFSKLAKANPNIPSIKNFTIGTVANLNKHGQIENLLNSVKIALNVIPNLQLVVIGNGEEKKKLIWITRKMEIDRHVWFVGEQEYLSKWFESFDLFFSISEKPNLYDLEIVAEAMSCKLPIIGFKDDNLSVLVDELKAGVLIEASKPEILSQTIIKLEQNKSEREAMGDKARKMAEKYFDRDRQIIQLKAIINN